MSRLLGYCQGQLKAHDPDLAIYVKGRFNSTIARLSIEAKDTQAR
jgi:hypothetical protein